MATVKTNTDVFEKAWEGFKGTDWKEKASVSRFVQANYTPYDGCLLYTSPSPRD